MVKPREASFRASVMPAGPAPMMQASKERSVRESADVVSKSTIMLGPDEISRETGGFVFRRAREAERRADRTGSRADRPPPSNNCGSAPFGQPAAERRPAR